MESSSLDPPRTPTRASSEGLSPPPRNSMEDADSSVTRKRPRLDSGDRVYRSMSAEPSISAPSTSDQAPPPSDLPQPSRPSSPGTITTPSMQTMNGTPSKVTINVRDQSLAHSPPQPTAKEPSAGQEGDQDLTYITNNMGDTNEQDVPSPRTVQPSSPSPIGSPQIEVAEPEDMEGHTGPTVWFRPKMGIFEAETLQYNLISQFPRVGEYGQVDGLGRAIAFIAAG